MTGATAVQAELSEDRSAVMSAGSVDDRHAQTPQPYSPVKRNSACQGPSEWTTSQ
jgi:hypothetical protein